MACGVVVGRKLRVLGTGPIDVSVSVAQSNRTCSCGVGLTAALAVGDGVRFRTSPWVILILPCSPRSLVLSCFSIPIPLSSLPTLGSLLSCRSIVVMASFGSVAVAVVVAVVVSLTSDRAGTDVGGVLTWRASATRSCCSGVFVVS